MIEKFDKPERRFFFWKGNDAKKKYHMVKLWRICISKRKGGLVVKDLRN
jgi:hypothetical protein